VTYHHIDMSTPFLDSGLLALQQSRALPPKWFAPGAIVTQTNIWRPRAMEHEGIIHDRNPGSFLSGVLALAIEADAIQTLGDPSGPAYLSVAGLCCQRG
jgi:hypothetical protein